MYELKHRKSFHFMQIQFEKNSCGFFKTHKKKSEYAAVASWLRYTIHHRMRTPYGHGVLIVLFVHNIFVCTNVYFNSPFICFACFFFSRLVVHFFLLCIFGGCVGGAALKTLLRIPPCRVGLGDFREDF